jgi:RimJ/RimL family protein N-acetyltransferase
MEKILIFIKHHFVFLWKIIEWGNGIIFSLFFKSEMEKVLPMVFKELAAPPFSYRRLDLSDADSLHELIQAQEVSDLEYFRPHGFDLIAVKRQFKNRSFLMMGAFDGGKMAGYFFLRFFANRKCFVGRLIDKDYRGKGIGPVMNSIMYETAWRMGFRCLSTISRNNTAVMRAHAKNKKMVVLKELQNNYLLVEFVR